MQQDDGIEPIGFRQRKRELKVSARVKQGSSGTPARLLKTRLAWLGAFFVAAMMVGRGMRDRGGMMDRHTRDMMKDMMRR